MRATTALLAMSEPAATESASIKEDEPLILRRFGPRLVASLGRILAPNEAPWLADIEAELLAFPSGKYDDQVDALLSFLEWFAQNERYLQPVIGCPVVITRQRDPLPWPGEPWPWPPNRPIFFLLPGNDARPARSISPA